MLPAIGYSISASGSHCLSDSQVEAVDVDPFESAEKGSVERVLSTYPFGVANLHLGDLPLGRQRLVDCERLEVARSLASRGWGTTVSVTLSALSPEPWNDNGITAAVDAVRGVQGRFDGSRLYIEVAPPVKEPSTPQRDADFVGELLKRTGCGWRLDVASVFARSRNAGFDPYDYIAEILPAATSILTCVSSARFEKRIGAFVTTAEGVIPDEVWSLVRHSLVLGCHKTRALFLAGREFRSSEKLRKSDLKHAHFLVDRVQGRQRLLRQHPVLGNDLNRGSMRGA